MNNLFISILVTLTLISGNIQAQRVKKNINENWDFRFSHQTNQNATYKVNLPHTWNAQDALSGKIDYKRGIGNYSKKISIPSEWNGKRVFIRFEGANSVTNLFINGKHVGEHRGGYSAFIFELTNILNYGTINDILVRVNNAEQLDIMPLVGDFNFYGGIYRDVEFIITEKACISPLDFASSGIYLQQTNVNDNCADVNLKLALSNNNKVNVNGTIIIKVKNGEKLIVEKIQDVTIMPATDVQYENIPFSIKKPHLWNGTENPFMYNVEVSLVVDNILTDMVCQPLGLRYYTVDPNKGFILNGKHLPLHGVNRHQERAEIGNALRRMNHEEDVAIMKEIGVNAVRLAHYPQAKYIYDLMDKNGIITWAEIPFVGPGGYADKGFVDMLSFRENGKMQLKELIRQNYNHPSICFWGLFNEIKEEGDNPVEYVKELNDLSHKEDPFRLTTAASNQYGNLNFITDIIAWNRYDGWYGSTPSTLAKWLDDTHKKYPDIKIGISEYGAGASIYHQQDTLVQTNPRSWWHPENWQTSYHIQNWNIIRQRQFIWGTFVWNMFDFGAAHRTEGDRPGINDKGLVTHDRKVRKDAFYFYKANWNDAPMIYIAEKRNDRMRLGKREIMVFSNLKEVSLICNGKSIGKCTPDENKICRFTVDLIKGNNNIEAFGTYKSKKIIDTNCFIVR